MGEIHVVFGAGQVGPHLAARLLAAGRRVRVVKRSASALPAGAELAAGDAADPAFCKEVARGASVLYHCMNPPYFAKAWADQLPRLADNLVAAARAAGARLVVLDNLYMLGRPADGRLDEETPFAPRSRKGETRARVAQVYVDAHQRGEAPVVIGRASDFYGPLGPRRRVRACVDAPVRTGWPLARDRRALLEGPRARHPDRDAAPLADEGPGALRADPARARGDGLPVGGAIRRGRLALPRPLRRPADGSRRGGPGDRGLGAGALRAREVSRWR